MTYDDLYIAAKEAAEVIKMKGYILKYSTLTDVAQLPLFLTADLLLKELGFCIWGLPEKEKEKGFGLYAIRSPGKPLWTVTVEQISLYSEYDMAIHIKEAILEWRESTNNNNGEQHE